MLRIFALSALVLGITACGGNSNSTGDTPTPEPTPSPTPTPTLFDQVETVARQDLANNDAAAVSIAVYQSGEIVFAEAYGSKVLGGNEQVTTDTLFQIGSTTKMFTGLAALKLIEQGLFNLDTPLTDALPNIQVPGEYAAHWQQITVEQMLTHSTGLLDNYIGVDDNLSLLDYMQSSYPVLNPPMNPAGLFYNYSNPSWSYLGAMVEYYTQTPYADWVEENVFDALGMHRSGFGTNTAANDGDYALGVYANGAGQMSLDETWATAAVIPAGAHTWSTPTEMLRMAEFLLNGNSDVLADNMRVAISSAQIDMDYSGAPYHITGLPYHYGYGIFVSDGFALDEQWYAEPVWEHGGNTNAHTSMFWILPEQQIAVSILSSGVGDDFRNTMHEILTELAITPSPQEIPDLQIDTTQLAQHVGTYNIDGIEVSISLEDGRLLIDAPELDAAGVIYDNQLTPFGDATFLIIIDGAIFDFTFFPEIEGGESVYMRNRNFVGIKQGYELAQSTLLAPQSKSVQAIFATPNDSL